MALNRDKFRNIVGGITTPKAEEMPAPRDVTPTAAAQAEQQHLPAGQGGEPAGRNSPAGEAKTGESRRFAQRGRPKGRKAETSDAKGRKVKVSLFLSEVLV